MNIYEILTAKKRGLPLSDEAIDFFVDGFVRGEIADYQASALLMAICINGMNDAETFALTRAMIASGDTVDLSPLGQSVCDKHSTGGVGDKVSLVLLPLVAACGLTVAKMSGRGLGHTGGTIDKLESIEGFDTALSRERFLSVARKTGFAITGQSEGLVPADKLLYALRDVTATVDSIPLIASSIMSKKIASGADVIVLDVKVGSGAFCKTEAEAKRLADTMIGLGKRAGKKVAALLTDMNTPLGNTIGNALELKEAIATLKGEGPDDLKDLCLTIAQTILHLAGKGDRNRCRRDALRALQDGSALEILRKTVSEQGGNVAQIDNPDLLPQCRYKQEVFAARSGYIVETDAERYGTAALLLGAGRRKKSDSVDHGAGIVLHKKLGDAVHAGESLATMYASDPALFAEAETTLLQATVLGDRPPCPTPVVLQTVLDR